LCAAFRTAFAIFLSSQVPANYREHAFRVRVIQPGHGVEQRVRARDLPSRGNELGDVERDHGVLSEGRGKLGKVSVTNQARSSVVPLEFVRHRLFRVTFNQPIGQH
jgi:hypothetical protein